MKIATLVCLSEGEIIGDIQTFNVDTPDGREKAIEAWKDRIKDAYEEDSDEEVLSRIEDGIICDFEYYDNRMDNCYSLYWGNME